MSSPMLTSSLAITGSKNAVQSGSDAYGITRFLVKYQVTQDPPGRK
jgi:hypothetical protein